MGLKELLPGQNQQPAPLWMDPDEPRERAPVPYPPQKVTPLAGEGTAGVAGSLAACGDRADGQAARKPVVMD